MKTIIYLIVFLGSALMVYNIYRYAGYLRRLLENDYRKEDRRKLFFPLILMIMFLGGYLAVGIFGSPDIIISAILFFGSVYVTIMTEVIQDITNHIQENEELKSELRIAEESSRAKSRFLSHMSHEIRTPMNAIIGMNALAMKDPVTPDETKEHLKKINDSAQHMLALINDILDISRTESGNVELKNEPFRFKEMIGQVSEMIAGQCKEKGVSFECLQDCLEDEICKGDQMKLKQILINILGNAVKFTPEGGSVTFNVQSGEISNELCPVHFIVRDTGIGIDEEYLPHIFDAFTQEDESATNRYGGSGLGMAITKSLLDMMDGQISVESEKGSGTEFTIDIVLGIVTGEAEEDVSLQSDYAAEQIQTGDPDSVSLEGKHILFAEDIELNAEILSDFLEMEDMTSEWACNGKECVDMFSASDEYTYDAILMDMRMPVMDGLTAARTIREMKREDAKIIPIIALSANAFEEDIQQSLAVGLDAHLSKPIDCDVLYDELRRQLAKRNVT